MTSVTKDMVIGDVVAKYPEAARIMTSHGLHCVGCGVSKFETIEQGWVGHGMDGDGLNAMLKEVNTFLEKHADAKLADGDYEIKTSGITLTAAAAEQVRTLMASEGTDGGLRINLLPGGCSGFMYSMNFEDAPTDEDEIFESQGVKIFVSKPGVSHLQGTTIDFVNTLNESGFTFDNPNAKSTCGCGKSFG